MPIQDDGKEPMHDLNPFLLRQGGFSVGSSILYNLCSPTTVTVGGLPAGSNIAGLSVVKILEMILCPELAPTYLPATLVVTKSSASQDEVGTAYSNNLLATFTQNDAGALTQIRIQKNGSNILPNGVFSTLSKVDVGSYVLGSITYQAFVDYGAGIIKNYTPSGTPDVRTPLIRNINAPQAAESNFGSTLISITGYYKYFYGATAAVLITSAAVRALPTSNLTSIGTSFSFTTGTIKKKFTIAMPATKTLVSVFDATAGFFITGSFILATFNVNDAGGNPVSYNVYTMSNAVPYATNHTLNVITT